MNDESRPKAAPEVLAGGLNDSNSTGDVPLAWVRPAVLTYGTSEAAADRQTPEKRSAVMSAVISIVARFGPCSDEEIAERYEAWRFLDTTLTDVSEQSLRTRRAEAVRQSLVRDSGRRGTTRRGSSCVLWGVVEQGVQDLHAPSGRGEAAWGANS